MVPEHPGKSILYWCKLHQWQFPFMFGVPGSHFVHLQSLGLLLLKDEYDAAEMPGEVLAQFFWN